MTSTFSSARLSACYRQAKQALLAQRNAGGHWEGELSTSALSTATAVMALEMVRRQRSHAEAEVPLTGESLSGLIERGLAWIAGHGNPDGGWGDTTLSLSNISTTMLCHAVFHATGSTERYVSVVERAKTYLDRAGGLPALRARYGKDRTFSIPILTHCALAGLVPWREVSPLPFELACLPAKFYKTVRLPVVSYALPALIAIGQARHHFRPPGNPLVRWLRNAAVPPSLRVLERIQPTSGGFLEATPLTSFVTMSLAGIGLAEHPVARRGLEFIVQSMRPDGSWPIDTNLATWVTTLSINALEGEVGEGRAELIRWLLDQQYRDVHPYTNADPGGWAWTDLSGGVPDSDDTPGAMLALLHLNAAASEPNVPRSSAALEEIGASLKNAAGWLLDLQNRDGGWPTFCRGWGALPFDRSAPDLTAHALRALDASRRVFPPDARTARRIQKGLESGFAYLARTQRKDGSWLPLWFGNQLAPDDENPTYGTSRVLAAYRDCNRTESEAARRGLDWLAGVQNVDGGWGGGAGIESSVEETALAADLLWGARPDSTAARRGACWLMDCVEDGRVHQSSPIGFYFAKLWYYEKLYPLIFTVAALGRACRGFQGSVPATAQPQPDRLTQETHP